MMQDFYAKILPLQIEMTLVQKIVAPYESTQMAGSVWLYRRQDVQAQK